MNKQPTFALRATVAALLPPAIAVGLIAGGVFGYGDPEADGWIRALPGVAVLTVPAVVILWLLYRRLGQIQLTGASLGRAISFSTTLAVPPALTILIVGFYMAPYRELPTVLLSAAQILLATWSCLFLGAWLQWRKLRPNNSFKPKPLRSGKNMA